MCEFLNNLSVDNWNVQSDGELNAENLELKLRTKYGHRFDTYRFNSGWSIGNHTHDHDKADAILNGQMQMIVVDAPTKQERTFVLNAGDIFYLPQNTLHRATVFADCTFYDSYK